MAKKIAVLGSINVDTTYHVQRFPMPGETISAGLVPRPGLSGWFGLTTRVSSCVKLFKKTISIPS